MCQVNLKSQSERTVDVKLVWEMYVIFIAGAGKHALPLPLQVTSLSGKQVAAEPSAGPGLQFPRDQSCPVPAAGSNPFITDSLHDSGPGSLDPRQSQAPGPGHRRIASADTQTFHSLPPNKDNPFLPGANGSHSELSRKVGGWNPFGDTQSFGAVTEDALFGNI